MLAAHVVCSPDGIRRPAYDLNGPAVAPIVSDGELSDAIYIDRRYKPPRCRKLTDDELLDSVGVSVPARKFCQGVSSKALRAVIARSTDVAIAGAVAHAIQRTLRSIMAMPEDAMLVHVANMPTSIQCLSARWRSKDQLIYRKG